MAPANLLQYKWRNFCPQFHDYPQQYYRFQQFLSASNDDLDDTSNYNIDNLEALAEQMIAEKTEEIERLCQQLL